MFDDSVIVRVLNIMEEVNYIIFNWFVYSISKLYIIETYIMHTQHITHVCIRKKWNDFYLNFEKACDTYGIRLYILKYIIKILIDL